MSLKPVDDPLRGRGINLIPGQKDDDEPSPHGHNRHVVPEIRSPGSQDGLDLELLLERQSDPDLARLVQAICGRTF